MSRIHVSVVSHGHGEMIAGLLADLAPSLHRGEVKATLVLNIPERLPFEPATFPNLEVLSNARPLGFGANHNRVFSTMAAPYFCVLNPDIRLPHDPFPALLRAFADEHVAVVAPAAFDPAGTLEDNARRLPTPLEVALRFLSRRSRPDYELDSVSAPDWVAGLFMLFRASAFRAVGGFDERYFLYYEDADICCRLRQAGYRVAWLPEARVVHDARRASRWNLRHLVWHARSVLRFFGSPSYRAARRLVRR